MSAQEHFPKFERTSKLLAIRIDGKRTTVRIFDGELKALQRICAATNVELNDFCADAAHDPKRVEHSLTAKIRGAMLSYLLDQWQPPKVRKRPAGKPGG